MGASGALLVGEVHPGSPAESAGLQPGAELVSVAGLPVAGRSSADVAAALRGPAGTVVEVIQRSGGVERAAVLTRAEVSEPIVTLRARADGVAVLTVTAFSQGAGAQVRAALAEARASDGPEGIVLDLRGNRGGLLDEAVEVAGAFLAPGPVVSYERRGQPDRQLASEAAGDTTTPLVVLVDGATASAAEVVVAALQDRRRAVVVGAQTYGKGVVQEPIRLSDGSSMELTVGRFRTPGGRTIDGVGVEPDVLLSASAGPAAGEQRAVEVLDGLSAGRTTASGRS
jgi:carboxyl-terminal processing protease